MPGKIIYEKSNLSAYFFKLVTMPVIIIAIFRQLRHQAEK